MLLIDDIPLNIKELLIRDKLITNQVLLLRRYRKKKQKQN